MNFAIQAVLDDSNNVDRDKCMDKSDSDKASSEPEASGTAADGDKADSDKAYATAMQLDISVRGAVTDSVVAGAEPTNTAWALATVG